MDVPLLKKWFKHVALDDGGRKQVVDGHYIVPYGDVERCVTTRRDERTNFDNRLIPAAPHGTVGLE